jgi:hypothetical protein
MTLPLRFHNSPYGGSSPAARRMAATIPTTITGVSLPLSYIGFYSVRTNCSLKASGEENRSRDHTLSVRIKAASAPAKRAATPMARREAFHFGHFLKHVVSDYQNQK